MLIAAGACRVLQPAVDTLAPRLSNVPTTPDSSPGFEALPVEQQMDYVQSLWDRIAARLEQIPVPDWHREVISERLADYRESPSEGKTWEEFEEELTREPPSQSGER